MSGAAAAAIPGLHKLCAPWRQQMLMKPKITNPFCIVQHCLKCMVHNDSNGPWSSQPLNLAPLSVTEAELAASKTSIHMNWVWWSIDQTCSKQKLCTGAWISIGLHWSAPHFQIVPNYCFLKKTNGFWKCVGTIDIFFDPQKWSQQLVAFIWFQSFSTWETIFFKNW